jgi:phenylalanyl-tRNA synthetase beta chain
MKFSPQWIREFVDINVDDHQLAEDLTSVGAAVEGTSGSGPDLVYDMEIGTNRPDEMNHYGLAREASAIYDVPLKSVATGTSPVVSANKPNFAIEIEESEGCARYTARILRGVAIKDSPAAIAKRLELVDQRPINNAADASNYTLWEIGHPTHAFDLDLLEGGKIIVRRARAGETLKTLDGVGRKLSPEDLIIADATKPVALAGVMGGFDTMITAKTRNILIESAWFDPTSVRRTARRHALHTDASHRFERGADYGASSLACARVAQRIIESGGGQPDGAELDTIARRLDLAPIQLDRSEVKRILGAELSNAEIQRILTRLGFLAAAGDGSDFIVQPPSWRLDVEREIDLIEEIARVHGYDKFANTLAAYTGAVKDLPDAAKDARLRGLLLAMGYNEAISLSFISHAEAETFSGAPVVELANPLSEEASLMRSSMLPGMLNMLAYNLNRGTENVRLFEAGPIYELAGSKSVELKRICLGATGSAVLPNVNQQARAFTFFDLKGDVETLLDTFEHRAVYYDPHTADYYHPGRSARAVMDGNAVAQFGQLHPDLAAARKLRQDIFIAEFYLDRLYKQGLRQIRFQPLPRYPAVERDFSFLFEDLVLFEKIRQSAEALRIAELRSFVPVEIFRGGAVGAGKYSILLRATFQSAERTLRDDEVARWTTQIVKALETLGGRQRA